MVWGLGALVAGGWLCPVTSWSIVAHSGILWGLGFRFRLGCRVWGLGFRV